MAYYAIFADCNCNWQYLAAGDAQETLNGDGLRRSSGQHCQHSGSEGSPWYIALLPLHSSTSYYNACLGSCSCVYRAEPGATRSAPVS